MCQCCQCDDSEMEDQKTCAICDSPDFKVIASQMREGPGRILQCKSCGLIIQDLDQSKAEIEEYYNKEYQFTNSLDAGREQTPKQHFEDRLKTLDPIVKILKPYLKKNMRILELGAGSGELLHLLKPYVKEVVGTELNKGFVDFMNKKLKIEAYAEDINKIDFKGRKFDLVISIAVLDHMPNPLETLKTIKQLLVPKKGLLYLELPNRDEALNVFLPDGNRERFNTFFWHKAHFFYFTKETITKLLKKAGFSSEITSRHEYTLINYLNWYFLGQPQKSFLSATTKSVLFSGKDPFEKKMNELFLKMEGRFHDIMEETMRGDILCCLGKTK